MNQVVLDHLMDRYPDISCNGFSIGDREFLKNNLDQIKQAVGYLHKYTRRCLMKQGTLCRDLVAAAELESGNTMCQGAMFIAVIALYIQYEQIGTDMLAGVRVLGNLEIF